MSRHILFITSMAAVSILVATLHAKEIITVFIHGTMHQSIRHQPCLYQSDLLLDLGIVGINIEAWNTKEEPSESDHYAAFHIINAFHTCAATHLESQQTKRHYYVFGWSGELSKDAREKASEQLYWAVNSEYHRLSANHAHIEIELYGHSHGNQLIFHLANIRNNHQEHTWTVDRAILSAAPLHYEMARHAFHPLFHSVINIYSEGDMIQTLDFISVPHGACKKTFQELEQLQPHLMKNDKCIIDLRLGAYEHYNFFGHGTFFTLDRYTPHPTLSRRLRNKYRQLITELQPLPLVSLYPLITPHCTMPHYQSLSANIMCDDQGPCIFLYDTGDKSHDPCIITIPPEFFTAQAFTRKKYASIGYTSELAKIYRVCVHALTHMFRKTPKI